MLLSGISPILESEWVPFMEFLKKYDFSPGQRDIFDFYMSVQATTAFAIRENGRIIGTGMSYGMGKTGWIGAICVEESYRRMGLGKKLTDYAVQALKNQGCSTVLLRASETGAKVYETLGFRRTGKYENFLWPEGGWDLPLHDNLQFREFSVLERRHIALESEMSGEDKSAYIYSMPTRTGIEAIENGRLTGYAYPSASDGIIGVTENEDLIGPLIARISKGKSFKIRTLIGSRANEYLHSFGYETKDGAIRMALGIDPIKNIRNIVGTVSSSIG